MKHLLSLIFLTILLAAAICSCRTSRQTDIEYSDSTSVSVVGTATMLTKDELFSLISASRELELSGIKVEFFPPDSVHPDARAAPKSLTIENAEAKESTEQATHEMVAVDEQKTVNLSAQSSSAIQQDTRNDTNIFHPPDWALLFSILSALIILSLIFLIKSRK